MATRSDGEKKGCIFQWKIENISLCWLKKGEFIESPPFIARAVAGTKWSLQLYHMGDKDENHVALYICRKITCSGPDKIKAYWQLTFLGEDGSILLETSLKSYNFRKNTVLGYPQIIQRERVFLTEREAFLSEDTLTIQLTLFNTNVKPTKFNLLFATTVVRVKRRTFVWRIEKVNALRSAHKRKFGDYLISFYLILSKDLDRLDMDQISIHNSIKYISCKPWIIDSEGKKEICEIKYFDDHLMKGLLPPMQILTKIVMENQRKYIPDYVLNLDIEFVCSTVEHYGHNRNSKLLKVVIDNEKSQKTADLAYDLRSTYDDDILGDMEIRTSTKTFPAHKDILSARSAVFRNMFSHDMRETISGHVDITDFEDNTIHRMLLFMYTDSLKDLDIESASDLYRIADKYEILSLKSRCSSYLIENLCPRDACSVLDMAVLHLDDDLKNSVQDYILGQRPQIFSSQEWKDFMNTHLKLAADIMHRKITEGLP